MDVTEEHGIGAAGAEPTPQGPDRTMVAVAAMMSAGAGLVHAAAAGTHNGDATLVAIFAVTAALQVGWAALAQARPTRSVLATGAVLNSLAVVAWALSRTVGLPWPASLTEVESVGTQDLLAVVLGGAAAISAALALRPARRGAAASGTAIAVAGVLALGLAVPGMATQHTHGPSHEHDHEGGEVAAGDDHAHGAATDAHDDHSEDHADHVDDGSPVISLDDPRLTDAQREAAQKLIDDTEAGMARFTDVASVEAAGYRSIGDAITGFEHFVNFEFTRNENNLDPDQIESIVFEVQPDGTKRLASAMYIMPAGSTMADAPDIAGPLTVWHDHQNLCWEGGRVVGLLIGGTCTPGGTLRPTAPMLHVWMIDHPCGPFAGLEGHGGSEDGCAHGHDEGGADADPTAGGHHHEIPARLDHEPTKAQRAAAQRLLDETRRDVAGYATTAAAEAAGYVSIGDSMTGVEHFVHREYLLNDTILDSTQPESLVYEVLPDGGRRLITAMYILPDGSTMDDVPDIAGNLTVWHDHQNLCWDPTFTKVRGILRNGSCVPGGTFRATSPMLHVWVVDNPCGPFAGTDRAGMTGSCVEEI